MANTAQVCGSNKMLLNHYLTLFASFQKTDFWSRNNTEAFITGVRNWQKFIKSEKCSWTRMLIIGCVLALIDQKSMNINGLADIATHKARNPLKRIKISITNDVVDRSQSNSHGDFVRLHFFIKCLVPKVLRLLSCGSPNRRQIFSQFKKTFGWHNAAFNLMRRVEWN